ncbi:MAG: right-handed parallel beta-helix repeat-containing protein, partial [Candidatus Nitrosocaldus sp.]|nr:right-handed parallel beta-helix repeat-containing protein [Candidatus Nitrosocaldus sp.]
YATDRLNNASSIGSITFTSYKVFNVRDYGAKGDGVADDTQAVKSTVEAARSYIASSSSSPPNPVIVYFPAGTYRITSLISIHSNMIVRGVRAATSTATEDQEGREGRGGGGGGGGESVIRLGMPFTAGSAVFKIEGAENVTVSRLVFDGQRQLTGHNTPTNRVSALLIGHNSRNVNVRESVFRDWRYTAVMLYGNTNAILIDSNVFRRNGNESKVTRVEEGITNDYDAAALQTSTKADTPYSSIIARNLLEYSGRDAIRVVTAKNVLVDSNVARYSVRNGIAVEGSGTSHVTITNNTCEYNGGSGRYQGAGIVVRNKGGPYVTDVVVRNNTVRWNYDNGIDFNTVSNGLIEGNTIAYNGYLASPEVDNSPSNPYGWPAQEGSGILLYLSRDCTVRNNIIHDNNYMVLVAPAKNRYRGGILVDPGRSNEFGSRMTGIVLTGNTERNEKGTHTWALKLGWLTSNSGLISGIRIIGERYESRIVQVPNAIDPADPPVIQ